MNGASEFCSRALAVPFEEDEEPKREEIAEELTVQPAANPYLVMLIRPRPMIATLRNEN